LSDTDTSAGAAGSGKPNKHATTAAPESFYRSLLEAAPDAMIVVDGDGRIAIANAEAEKMFRYSREKLLGEYIEILLPERYRNRHTGQRHDFVDAPRVRRMGVGMEFVGMRSDGTEFPVEISLSPIHCSSGFFVSSVIRDVTERRRIEEALTTARQAAERANEANTAFLAAASHDLRQPVQALGLLTGALRRTTKDPLMLEMIQSQQESLDAMTNLLNSLLDIGRLDAGAVEPNIEEFPVGRLFGRLASELSRQAKQKKLLFDIESSQVRIRSDPNLLAEIIQNFASNAVRYTEQGGVRLTCTQEENEVSITVADTGIGIEPEQLENIFKEFHQIKNNRRKREGFGLGLAIARRLAGLLGHAITVESTPGVGSSFSVRVPLASVGHAAASSEPDTVSSGPVASPLIMLVEDDMKVATAWQLLLRAEGYRVATAESASEARIVLAKLRDPPRLIISDYHLANGSNGVEAVSVIRQDLGACVPAFIVTGDTSKVVQDVENLENSRVMSKPINPDTLLRLAQAAIASGQA
jgi:PAS domain S-box-containing protein